MTVYQHQHVHGDRLIVMFSRESPPDNTRCLSKSVPETRVVFESVFLKVNHELPCTQIIYLVSQVREICEWFVDSAGNFHFIVVSNYLPLSYRIVHVCIPGTPSRQHAHVFVSHSAVTDFLYPCVEICQSLPWGLDHDPTYVRRFYQKLCPFQLGE
ncbi:hypothetical protein [Salmon gill poxvirus]|nr:hypothetical protein [Salmon gill poxvirus]